MGIIEAASKAALDIQAGCLNQVAGIAMREVQRMTAGASTSTAAAGRSGEVLFVHSFGTTLNAHVHLHLSMLDGVVAQGRQGLVFRRARVDEACVHHAAVYVRRRPERSAAYQVVRQNLEPWLARRCAGRRGAATHGAHGSDR